MSAAAAIQARLDELAQEITRRHFELRPEAAEKYGERGRIRTLEDARFHLQFLATAVDAGSPAMFIDYIGWVKIVLEQRNVSSQELVAHLEIIASLLSERLPDHAREPVRLLLAAIEQLPSLPTDVPTHLDPRQPLFAPASEYLTALLGGDREAAFRIVDRALEDGATLRDVYRQIFEPVQQEVGRLWQINRLTVAQEHFSTAATQHIMTRLYGRMFTGRKRERRAVAMCVGGELHEIGLRIITDLMELDGWQTWYLGASVPPAAAIDLCADRQTDVLLVSATLPPHLAQVEEVVRLFRERTELKRSKIIVGGGAFRSATDLWRRMGADGYARNADECLALLERIA